jgi:hypothetical protein
MDRRSCAAAARARLEGRSEPYSEIAAEFVRLRVDVIVVMGSAAYTVKQATAVIPIVFVLAIDSVGGGLVASLARPGGNVTGLSVQQTDLAGKRVELLAYPKQRLTDQNLGRTDFRASDVRSMKCKAC